MSADYEQQYARQQRLKNIISDQIRLIGDYEKTILQSALIVNGVAAISLLAFIGSIWSEQIKESVETHLILALTYFACGVLGAVMSMLVGYTAARGKYWIYLQVEEAGQDVEEVDIPILLRIKAKAGNLINYYIITMFLFVVIASYILFYLGVYETSQAFQIQILNKGTSIYSQIDILAVNDFNKLATLCIEKCLLLEVPINETSRLPAS